MTDVNQGGEKLVIERRTGRDRRIGKLDDKFQHSVSIGFFLDMRKGDRRKRLVDTISLN